MNRNQKIVLMVGLLLILLSGLFPFYTHEYAKFDGYSFFFNSNGRIVFSRYLIQIITISILTVGLIILFKDIVLKKNQLRNIILAILLIVVLVLLGYFVFKTIAVNKKQTPEYDYSKYFK